MSTMKKMMMSIMMRTMHKYTFAILVLGSLVLPLVSSAHETRMYEINGVPYEIVVGSLGEPVIVDDKTGVDVEIIRDGVPLQGAQESLQIEMSAGEAKKIVDLAPVYGIEGKYKSNFIATVPTTISYRLFGTLEETPVDVSFTCNPAGHPASEEETAEVEVSDNVTQTLKRGSFGCPQAKEAFGFPEAAPSALSLKESAAEIPETNGDMLPKAALVISVLAGAFAVAAYSKKR